MNTIKITVEGGVIQDITDIPEGVKIIVADFDTEGVPENECQRSADGDLYTASVWTRQEVMA
jgi:hypothetical protein